ncbi:MAG: hypothetical protein B7Z51_08270, partial [Methyloversatilis sp. 12-65-5]
MQSFPVTFALYAYGVAAVGFALFGLQLIMGARQSPRARLLSVCMVSGAVWCALASLSVLRDYPLLRTLVYAADALHTLLFLLFLAACVIDPEGRQPLPTLLKRPSWLIRFVLISV